MWVWVKEVAHPETHPPVTSFPRLASLAARAQHLPKGPRLLREPLEAQAPAADGEQSHTRAMGDPHSGPTLGPPPINASPRQAPQQRPEALDGWLMGGISNYQKVN